VHPSAFGYRPASRRISSRASILFLLCEILTLSSHFCKQHLLQIFKTKRKQGASVVLERPSESHITVAPVRVQERAKEEIVWLMRRGTQWWQAEEVALAPWMFPTEKEQPTLTQDQMPFLPVE
jgi:hypothetical protein